MTQPPSGPPPYGQPTPDQPQYGQPQYGQPPAQPQYGQPPAQPQYGQPPAQPQYGQPPAQPSYGQPPYGQPPSAAPSYPGAPPAYPGAPPAYPGAAAGYQVAPPKKSRTGLIVGLVIGAVVLLLLCVFGIGAIAFYGSKTSTTTGPTSALPPSQQPPAAQHFTGDLRDILLKPPAGAQTGKPNSANEDGTVTLENAASFLYYTQPEGPGQLRTFGYVKGAMVAFGQNGHQVTSALFQFKDAAGASRTYQSIVDGYEKDPTLGQKGTLPGVPNVRYAQASQTISGLHVIIAYYVRNDLYGSVLYYSQDAAGPEVLAPYVSQQLALLP